jgi:Fur family ferric uptake transcriptional regulator
MSEISTNFMNRTIEYQELLKNFKNLLKNNSLKFTKQREVILQSLYNSTAHLTPEDIYKDIQNKYPDLKVGIATIYRTLTLLEDSNMLTFLSFGAAGKKYELGAKQHHDHMICTACGHITEFVDEQIEQRQHKIAQELDFEMHDHSMQIYGICKNCKTN